MARLDPGESFEALKDGLKDAITESFPHVGAKQTLELKKIEIDDKIESDDYPGQKKSKMEGRTWGVPVKAEMVLRDNKTGKVVDKITKKIATLPKETNRFSYIVDGAEYQVDNQWRLKPGVYTKVKENGELDSFFNIEGRPLHVGFNPKDRKFKAQYGGLNPPLYPILKAMNISDDELIKKWGEDIFHANTLDIRGKRINIDKEAVKIAKRLNPKAQVRDFSEASDVIQQAFADSKLDPSVTERTLGKPIPNINQEALLLSSKRLLGVARGEEKEDARDSLLFKNLLSTEDFMQERIRGGHRVINRKIQNNIDRKSTIREIVTPDVFNKPIKEFFGKVSLANTPPQTNPLRMIGGQMKTTIAGEGGVSDANKIPEDAKLVDPSHFGVLDPLQTPESALTGVSLQIALGAKKKGKTIVTPLINTKTGKVELVNPEKMYDSTVALPDTVVYKNGRVIPKEGKKVLSSTPGNQLHPVPLSDVDYIMPKSSQMFAFGTNMIPFINSNSPNRTTMAGRHMEQAIPLVDGEPPLVQSAVGDTTFDEMLGQFSSHTAPVSGKVTHIDKDHITIASGKTVKKIPLYNNYPLNDKKGFVDSKPLVKVGDKVKEGQLVADTNFSNNGVYSPGKNLRVAYTPWAGLNFEDGVVISESASKKLSSAHMYKKGVSSKDIESGKEKFRSYYPTRMTKEQLDKLDDDGVIQVGQKVKPGDTLITGLQDQQLTTEQQKLRLLHKSLVQPKKDKSITWEEDYEGEVVDVSKKGNRINVHVKTVEPMEVGDKLCYDEKTEVLTYTGWKPIADVTVKDAVCCLDNGQIVYEHPIEIFAYDRGGDMYKISSQQIDLFVTLNHQMYVQQRNKNNYELLPAKEIYGKRVRYAKSGIWRGIDQSHIQFPELRVKAGQYGHGSRLLPEFQLEMDTFLILLGAFLADGNCFEHQDSGPYGIAFTKIREPHRTQLRDLLNKTGIKWTNGGEKTRIYSKQLLHYFRRFGHAHEKYIPIEIFDLPRERLEILFHWLFIWGDGTSKDGRPISQWTVSKRLADDIQRLALHLGMAANIQIAHEEGEQIINGKSYHVRKTYDVRIVTSKLQPQVNHGHTKEQSAQTEEIIKNYQGPVFCLTVPTHVLYVRRDGKPVWCGNCGRSGNKGIAVSILPDSEMPKGKDGKPIEILMNPIGIAGRMNVGQVLETAASKVAEKDGKTFRTESFSQKDNLEHVKSELRKRGLQDKEDLTDPVTGKTIPGVLAGKQYILKMEHQVDKKMSARSRDAYDHNLVPRGGGKHGGQSLGSLGIYALLAHGAKENLHESFTIKSDKSQGGLNDDLWNALQTGETLPPPRETFAFQKFKSYLKTLGVNTEKDGNSLNLIPLTDKQITDMSEGEIKDAGRMVRMKDLRPEKGGLFDEKITGGHGGNKWGHLKLASSMPNPLFEKAIISLTKLNAPQFNKIIDGEYGVSKEGELIKEKSVSGASYGPSAVGKLLERVDVGRELKEGREALSSLTGQAQNEARRRVKYLRALEKLKLSPTEAYMTSAVPVLPPSMRPLSVLDDGSIQTDDLNELYKGLALVNNKYKEFPKGTPEAIKAPLEASVYDHLKALSGLGGTLNNKHPGIMHILAGKGSPKSSFVQDVLIKRKQDLSMRSTIVPEPSLSLDEVELPKSAAMEMYKPFVVRELRRATSAPFSDIKKMIKENDPLATKALERVVDTRPVLLKRDPALHKYGIQAFKPRLVDGKAIKIHPLVCSAYSADFDGDSQISCVVAEVSKRWYKANRNFCNLRRCEMTARFNEMVSCMGNGVFIACNLEDFPHLKEKATRGHIDYHPVPEGIKVVALGANGHPILAEVSGWSKHIGRKMEIVTLGSGRQISTDDDERAIFGVDASSLEWCRRRPSEALNQFVPVLSDITFASIDKPLTKISLEAGEFVNQRIQRNTPLNFEFGYFLGCLIGDGWATTGTVNLANTCDPIIDRWKDASTKLFKYHAPAFTESLLSRGQFEGSRGSRRITISCTELERFVRIMIGSGAENKHLPPFFYQAGKEFLRGLLSGLWDTDGSVSWSNAKNKKQLMCHYSSNSFRLVQEIQHLLRMFDVTATITKSKTPRGKATWVLMLSSVELHQNDGIHFDLAHPDKRRVFKEFLDGPCPSVLMAYSRFRLVPIPGALAKELRTIISPKIKNLYTILSNSIKRQYLSKETAKVIVNRIKDECKHPLYTKWKELVNNHNIHFERIVKIERTEIEEDGYDLTVPGYETFMSTDGIILSNTMSAYVPVRDKAVMEAYNMFPSKNLFSPASGEVMFKPTHEQQVGLYMATEVGKDIKKTFPSQSELESSFRKGEVKLTDVVTVGRSKTTLGRLRLNSQLPESLQGGKILDLNYRLTKKEQNKFFQEMAKKAPDEYPKIVNNLKDVGNTIASTEGFSFGLDDFEVHKDVRDPIFRNADLEVKAQRLDTRKEADAQKLVDIYSDAMIELDKQVLRKAHDPRNKSQLARLESAAGIKGRGYLQLKGAPTLFVDGKGAVVPSPVRKSYAEGLSAGDYWSAVSGGRKGIVQKVQSVSDPGYLTKMMTNSVLDRVVTADDCGTDKGVSLSIDEPDIQGRYTISDIPAGRTVIPKGTLLTPELVTKIKSHKPGAKVAVRSPMRCSHAKGLCAKCMGLNEDGQHYDIGTNIGVMSAQSIGERGTQLAMKNFHAGGIYAGKDEKSLTSEGLDRALTLLYLPEKVKGSASLAPVKGKITDITKDPAGGLRVRIGETETYIPANRKPLSSLKVGSLIRKGDRLSGGPVNPHELLPLTGVNPVQGHLASELHDIYGKYGIKRRHSEVIVGALTSITKVTDPGGHSDLLPGDFASTNQVQEFNRKNSSNPVTHTPVLRGVKQIPLDVQEDWLARLNHERLKSTYIEASQQGWSSDLAGLNPIPALISGTGFTKKK